MMSYVRNWDFLLVNICPFIVCPNLTSVENCCFAHSFQIRIQLTYFSALYSLMRGLLISSVIYLSRSTLYNGNAASL